MGFGVSPDYCFNNPLFAYLDYELNYGKVLKLFLSCNKRFFLFD